jgi:hypothetical protein
MPDPNAAAPVAEKPAVEPKSAFEAVQLEMQGEITVPAPDPEPAPDPQPGDPNPGPDSAPKAPEGDGATDPSDNAPQDPVPKPDDKKTVEPTDPKADDPKVEVPGKDGGGAQKKPSDEFGSLDERVSEKTRERFNTMKGRYDEVTADLEAARETNRKWIETVKSTGMTPEQFGGHLEYMRLATSSAPADNEAAFERLQEAYLVMAKKLGKPVAGAYDPLDEYPDLKQQVEDGANRQLVLEVAQSRRRAALDQSHQQQVQQVGAVERQANEALAEVQQFGAQMRAADPLYAEKSAAIRDYVADVVAELPPDQWLPKIKAKWATINVQPAAPPPPPPVNTGMRQGNGPGPSTAKEPASVFEAVQQGMQW